VAVRTSSNALFSINTVTVQWVKLALVCQARFSLPSLYGKDSEYQQWLGSKWAHHVIHQLHIHGQCELVSGWGL